MADILDNIVAHKRIEVAEFKAALSPATLYAEVEKMMYTTQVPSMRDALLNSETGIISEFKRRSPSKGWIMQEGKPQLIPLAYQENGASAISILTDNQFFGGEDSYVTMARESGVTLPVLYKNFIIDEYQLFQARRCGASAVLLIASVLKKAECRALIRRAHDLRLEVLLETHHERETEYAELEPDMCGVNNRNLGTFITSVDNSFRLSRLLPKDMCLVSESGISDAKTIRQLRGAGYRGFLIGETFMKTGNPGKALRELITQLAEAGTSNP